MAIKKAGKIIKEKKIVREFKEFVLRGNVIDLAVGVIVGGAFSGITGSLVNDVIMPIVGTFIGGINFSALNISIPPIFPDKEATALNLGSFAATVINFFILAFIIFWLVKAVNRLRKKKEEVPVPAEPEPSREEILLAEIRDILKDRSDR